MAEQEPEGQRRSACPEAEVLIRDLAGVEPCIPVAPGRPEGGSSGFYVEEGLRHQAPSSILACWIDAATSALRHRGDRFRPKAGMEIFNNARALDQYRPIRRKIPARPTPHLAITGADSSPACGVSAPRSRPALPTPLSIAILALGAKTACYPRDSLLYCEIQTIS